MMKKLLSVFLVFAMLFSFASIASATSYRDPVDGIKMHPGLNPVVKFTDGNKYEYTLYAVEMDGITNADISLLYPENVIIEDFKEKGEFDMCIHFDAGDRLNVSFMYESENTSEAFKLFTVTFSYAGEAQFPEVKLTNLAGTFIKSVAEIVFINEAGAEITAIKGDIDMNGKITAADARLVLRHSSKLETLSSSQQKNADVNGDGKITSSDARLILRVASGLDKEF